MLGVVPRADDEDAAPVCRQHCLLRVDDQIEQHLLHLMAVGKHLGKSRGQRVDDADVRDTLVVRAQRQRLTHDVVDVDHGARRLPLAREGQQVANDAGGALGFVENCLEAPPHAVVLGRLLRQPLGPAQNGGQRIVQLVGDA